VFDHNGKMIEDWSQWDRIWGRPHDVEISPYDPQKNIWIVDADAHFVSKFTHDGKQRLLTLGTPGVPGTDDTHFSRPTFMAFMDANTWYLADGYDGTRVIKYDMNGKKLLEWGMKGTPPNERRPAYFNSVHGIAVNPKTRRVYVNDRNNGRLQVFDENGKFLDQWDFGPRPPMNIHSIYMGRTASCGPPIRVEQAARVRRSGTPAVFMGHVRNVSGMPVGHPRVRDRQGRQPLHG
jgi:DNA-binding beta-propeller fold protein YncE